MIGQGVYTLSEAARYAGVPVATVRSWFKARSDGKGQGPLFKSDHDPVDGDYAVSFLNLIEIYVARFFRTEGVQPPILRRAHEILQAELNTRHPFAHADLRAECGRIIIKKMPDADLVDVVSKQQFFGQMNLGRIAYNQVSRMAEAWGIAEGVIINPRMGFGKPVVGETGVSTLIVARQYIANHKDEALVARLFRIPPAGVVQAYDFERALKRIAA